MTLTDPLIFEFMRPHKSATIAKTDRRTLSSLQYVTLKSYAYIGCADNIQRAANSRYKIMVLQEVGKTLARINRPARYGLAEAFLRVGSGHEG